MTPPTPCQKCKARVQELEQTLAGADSMAVHYTRQLMALERERDELKAHVRRLEAQLAHKHQGARGYPCPRCQVMLSVCDQHGPYVRTDENQCGACRRGE